MNENFSIAFFLILVLANSPFHFPGPRVAPSTYRGSISRQTSHQFHRKPAMKSPAALTVDGMSLTATDELQTNGQMGVCGTLSRPPLRCCLTATRHPYRYPLPVPPPFIAAPNSKCSFRYRG
ncbi:hypothetical protein E2C01_096284 [Portunus trituberculatus]|uniref:Uncharacterized protein n=1 Tax=Portunus trituberculatus TaxID=210409 RepID=A0A5B7K7U3_PORTR|nr:hypothetical protein [Portunus trituberculatus]